MAQFASTNAIAVSRKIVSVVDSNTIRYVSNMTREFRYFLPFIVEFLEYGDSTRFSFALTYNCKNE